MATRAGAPAGPTALAAAVATELLSLPGPLRRFLLRHLLERLIPDANRYFFTGAKEAIRERLRTALDSVGGPVVVIGHSLGTVVAYDVLSEPRFTGRPVPLFVTLDTTLADDFRAPTRVIAGVPVGNRSPNNHASYGYLRAGRVRSAVRAAG
ncbi:hypothetical protein QFZ75_007218 [Streptomyces sp. V3I8]|uniref:hypothetical protein n=1 Tax=Streptomyces sp. V3I8 TaxID=3042279 RepID=UPI00277E5FA3|nr:hypothetical protein [Streptomyces sp. V3I8]MDQ1040802.1 hypothetical protein [Streptomyces sp. V3I8]